jgi:hypothetical protein
MGRSLPLRISEAFLDGVVDARPQAAGLITAPDDCSPSPKKCKKRTNNNAANDQDEGYRDIAHYAASPVLWGSAKASRSAGYKSGRS